MISIHLYLYKHVLSAMGICFSKEKKKPEIFITYIFVKLLNQDEAKDFKLLKYSNTKTIDKKKAKKVYL
jgi:hypothetical protein